MALYKAGSQFNYHSAEALPRPNSMKQRAGLDFTQLAQAVLHLVVPPCIFLFTSSLLSFHVHFDVGAGVWLLTLLSLVPFCLARRSERHALEYRLDRTWPRLSQFLSTGTFRKSYSSGTLQKSGQATITSPMAADHEMPKLPKYLNVTNLTKFRKLPPSTGNLHGWLAEDYSQINWPLPKMFGKEKYGYSMIDIDDPRYIKECAQMSQKLIRLHYDQQIIDYTWRNTYKGLLTAEHRLATLPENKCPQKTQDLMKKEVDSCMKQLLELQQQKDMYEQQIKEIYERCDSIKATIKKENDLEDLRKTMEKQTKEKISSDSPFWKAKFNIRSVNAPPRSGSLSFD